MLLADDKKTSYVIVYRKDHSESEQTAVDELQKYLKMLSGADFPIVTDDTPKAEREIVVGFCARPGCKEVKKLGDEGFTIRTDGKRLLILGSEVRGALYGVYTFLEKFCGCRFFAADFEKIPDEVRTFNISDNIDDTEIPLLEYRNVYWGVIKDEMISAKLKSNGGMGHKITSKVGGSIDYIGDFCHTFAFLNEQDNYWDMPCLNDEEVYQRVLKNVKKQLRANPDKHIISVSQLDGNNGECSCPKCAKVYEEEQSHMGNLLRFVNRISDDVEEEFPGTIIDTLAYRYTRKPPIKTKPKKNVIIRLCNIECCFRHPLGECPAEADERAKGDSFVDNLKNWNALTDKLYIWDYTTNFSNMSTMFPNFDCLRKNVVTFVDNGVKGIFEQGKSSNSNGEWAELRAYVLSKLLWDPYMDESEYRGHISEFMNAYYGAGGKYMEDFLNLEHACSKEGHMNIYFDNSANFIYLKGYKDKLAGAYAFYDQASDLFDKAEAAAWGDVIRASRKGYRHGEDDEDDYCNNEEYAKAKKMYDHVRRSRIQLYNYHCFLMVMAQNVYAEAEKKKHDPMNQVMIDALEHSRVEDNRMQYALMREFNVDEPMEFRRIHFDKVQDYHGYALWWD